MQEPSISPAAIALDRSPASGPAARLSPPEFLDRLDIATQQFAELVSDAELDAPVLSCPDWTFADLVVHLGGIHQWATHAVVAGNPDAHPIPAPSPGPALLDWYRDAATGLIRVLRETDPQTPAWTFGPKPRTASFWFRRQVHETVIHLWDAEISRAQAQARPIDEIVALDGIDELTGVFFPRQVRLGRTAPLGRALALEVTGFTADKRWILAGDGIGATSDTPADATVTGPAEALLLLLWGRITVDDPRLTLSGDVSAAEAVLGSALTP